MCAGTLDSADADGDGEMSVLDVDGVVGTHSAKDPTLIRSGGTDLRYYALQVMSSPQHIGDLIFP